MKKGAIKYKFPVFRFLKFSCLWKNKRYLYQRRSGWYSFINLQVGFRRDTLMLLLIRAHATNRISSTARDAMDLITKAN